MDSSPLLKDWSDAHLYRNHIVPWLQRLERDQGRERLPDSG